VIKFTKGNNYLIAFLTILLFIGTLFNMVYPLVFFQIPILISILSMFSLTLIQYFYLDKFYKKIYETDYINIVNHLIIFVLVILFSFTVIPRIAHIFNSVEKDVKVIVTGKGMRYGSKICTKTGGIYVTSIEGENFKNDVICNISREDWDNIKNGDLVELSGSYSEYGFHYSQYDIITKRRSQ